jgi:hypothetical protein
MSDKLHLGHKKSETNYDLWAQLEKVVSSSPRCKCGRKLVDINMVATLWFCMFYDYSTAACAELLNEYRRQQGYLSPVTLSVIERIKLELHNLRHIHCKCWRQRKFSELTSDAAVTWLLRHKYGQSNADIAEHLKISRSAVTQRFQKLDLTVHGWANVGNSKDPDLEYVEHSTLDYLAHRRPHTQHNEKVTDDFNKNIIDDADGGKI